VFEGKLQPDLTHVPVCQVIREKCHSLLVIACIYTGLGPNFQYLFNCLLIVWVVGFLSDVTVDAWSDKGPIKLKDDL
jgi:hypothetical protein